MESTALLSPHEEADPLTDHLATVLLPEMAFTGLPLEMVVECLRHLARRAMEASIFPVPGGISISLVAPPSTRAKLVSLQITLGTTLEDALVLLAQQGGLAMRYAALGVIICPPELAEAIRLASSEDAPAPPPGVPYHALAREHWLRLVALYPVLAVTSSPIPSEWVEAFNVSARTPDDAFRLARDIVECHADDGCTPLTQIPIYLPRVEDGSPPSIPGI